MKPTLFDEELKQLIRDASEFVSRKYNQRIMDEERLRVRLERAVDSFNGQTKTDPSNVQDFSLS